MKQTFIKNSVPDTKNKNYNNYYLVFFFLFPVLTPIYTIHAYYHKFKRLHQILILWIVVFYMVATNYSQLVKRNVACGLFVCIYGLVLNIL